MTSLRFPLAAAGVLAAALLLSACSTGLPGSETAPTASASASASAPEASSKTFNDTDVSFVAPMIDHHNQAIAMAETMLTKTGVDPRVTSLAQKIKAAQEPEITTLTSWAEAWRAKDSMPGMDMSAGSMPGADMTALDSATGPAADKLFLEQMVQHHQGAIDMATVEVKSGVNPDARDLATKIIADQTAEIAEMRTILDTM
jgi:uncharacterized protein (DUF305 family)